MDHTFYTDRLSAYFDQELKNEEHVIVDQHVKECQECQKILANLKKFDSFVDENTELSDNDYWEKSAQKIEKALYGDTKTEVVDIKHESFYKGLWWKLAGVAASIAVIAFISLYETDITDQLDKKYNAPAPPAEKMEEADEQKQVPTETREQEEPSKNVTEDSKNRDLETPSASIPENVPDIIVSSQEKPDVTSFSITKSERQVQSEGADEDISLGRVDKDVDNLMQSEETPQTSPPPSLAPKKAKLVEKSAEAADSYEMELKEMRDEASSLTSKTADPEEQNEKLAMWQNTVVTQNNILSSLKSKKTSKKLTNGFAASGSISDTTDKKEIYNELFEAYYNVALLSKDSLERKNALLQLNNYANDPQFIYQNTAKLYLNQFDSVQNSNAVIKRNKRK